MAKAAKRPTLGRGLDSLIRETVSFDEDGPAPSEGVENLLTLPIEHLSPNPDQPRRRFGTEELASLAESISKKGILQPILVRPDPTADDRYQIVAGERRWRAAQRARLHEVPVIVRSLDDLETLEIAIIENVQREDLSPVEEARGYRRLIDQFGHTQDRLARAIGKSRPHIANTLRLLDLPTSVQAKVEAGALSAGHARALIGTPDPVGLAETVIAKELSVRQTEALARAGATPTVRRRARKGVGAKDADTIDLERRLSDRLGLRVDIRHQPDGSGALSIGYRSLEQLDDLIAKVGRL